MQGQPLPIVFFFYRSLLTPLKQFDMVIAVYLIFDTVEVVRRVWWWIHSDLKLESAQQDDVITHASDLQGKEKNCVNHRKSEGWDRYYYFLRLAA